ncbi:DUF6503 family protein [Mesonia ostreae]|uniref:DUF6503 family protein n=1 Tax=Mesonia ostreae TaxID=861110 RepID=A0ABU2KH04_9FLAO|nr:DUF6503 family protein [Mesonia ostreae]MDT0293933.1 DUF6503 family protein [Mesonia ostreae]
MTKYILLVLVSFAIFSCQEEKKTKKENDKATVTQKDIEQKETLSPAEQFAANIQSAHQTSNFKSQEAIQFKLNLKFGGKQRMNAKITMLTNSSKIRIEKEDGTILMYDNEKAFLFPKENNYDGARFDMFTWTYFFALPFKLTDRGTNWQDLKENELNETQYETAKLTFGDNIGDAPDDWYVIYSDKQTKLMKAAAYIVTFGKDTATAEENPHAIVYDNYFSVNGVAFAKEWFFYNWSEEKGIYGDPIGSGEISNVKFIIAKEDFFIAPKESIEIKK